MTKRADDYYLGAIARANYLGLALAHHNESAQKFPLEEF
jgi:hypothetical protein